MISNLIYLKLYD